MCTGLTKAGPRVVNTFGRGPLKGASAVHIMQTVGARIQGLKRYIFGCPRHVQTHHGVIKYRHVHGLPYA